MSSVAIATAYIQLVPTFQGVQGAIGQQLGAAGGQASQAGRRAGQAYSNAFGGSVKKIAATIGGLALGKQVVDFAVASVKSLARIETFNKQTESVIKATGNAANVTAQEIFDLTGELENMTATEAETIQGGANFLLTFKDIKNQLGDGNDIFNQTVKVMTDMARATGGSMQGAALQLGKALNDPIKGVAALGRVGVTFTDSQKEMIRTLVETGDVMGAQKIILAELNSEFGGSAEAYASTAIGKWELLKHAVGTFGEAATANVLPVFGKISKAGADFFNEAAVWVEGYNALPPSLIRFADTIKNNVIARVEEVAPVMREAGGVVKDSMVAAFEKLQPAVSGLLPSLAELAPLLNPVSLVFNALKPVLPSLADSFGRIATAGAELLVSALEALEPVLSGVVDIFEGAGPVINGFAEVFADVASFVADAAEAFGRLSGPAQLTGAALVALVLLRRPLVSMFQTIYLNALYAAGGLSTLGARAVAVGKTLGKAGAIGLAITAITLLTSAFTDSDTSAEDFATSVQGVAATLDAATGSITRFTAEKLGMDLANEGATRILKEMGLSTAQYTRDILAGKGVISESGDALVAVGAKAVEASRGYAGLRDSMAAANITSADVAKAIASQNWDDVNAKIDAYNSRVSTSDMILSNSVQSLDEQAGGLAFLYGKLAGATDIYTAAQVTQKDAIEATGASLNPFYDDVDRGGGAMFQLAEGADAASVAVASAGAAAGTAEEPYSAMAEALTEASDASSALGDKVSYARQQLDILSGRTPTVEQAMADLDQTMSDLAEQWDASQEGVQRLGVGILNADGSINTATQGARDFRDSALAMSDATLAAAAAAFENSRATGGSLTDATNAARAAAEKGSQAFLNTAGSVLGNAEAANTLAAKYGLLPDNIVTSVRLAGLDQTQAQLDAFQNQDRTIVYNVKVNQSAGLSLSDNRFQAATGGEVPGWMGTPNKDSVPALLMPDEHIFTKAEVSKLGGHAAVYALRRSIMAGNVPRYATGGGVPSSSALSGVGARSTGQREGNVVKALEDLRGAVTAARDTYLKLADADKQERRDLVAAQKKQREVGADGRGKIADAEKRQAEVRASGVERVQDAEKRLAELRAKGAKASADQLAGAADAVAKARKAADKANAAEVDRLEKVRAAAAKADKAQSAAVLAQTKLTDRAKDQAEAARRNAVASRAAYEAQERNRRSLVSLSRQYDNATDRLSTARGKLEQLNGAAKSMADSIAGNLEGTGGGLTGFADKRNTPASILAGLKFNQGNVQMFERQIKTLKGKGLSAKYLEELASGGVDNAGATTRVLAGASKGEIAAINRTLAATAASAKRTGAVTADAVYGKQQDAATKAVKELRETVKDLADDMGDLAERIQRGVTKGLTNSRFAVQSDGFGRVITKAQTSAARRK